MIKLFESVEDLKKSGYLFRITDNGGATADRFTIIYCDGSYLGASCYPYHPQGVGMHGEDIDVQGVADRVEEGTERDLRFIDLPEQVRDCVLGGNNRGFADYLEAEPAAATRDEARDWEGIWTDHFGNRTPIYREGNSFRIRDDERATEDGGDPGPFATFVEAVRYMLPQDYDLSGPEYHTTVDLWDETGGPAPLWDYYADSVLITEDASERTVTRNEAESLAQQGLIYKCDECKDTYHIAGDHTWQDVEAEL